MCSIRAYSVSDARADASIREWPPSEYCEVGKRGKNARSGDRPSQVRICHRDFCRTHDVQWIRCVGSLPLPKLLIGYSLTLSIICFVRLQALIYRVLPSASVRAGSLTLWNY